MPCGGLVRHGARQESLETLVSELARESSGDNANSCWTIARKKKKKPKAAKKPKSAMQEELEKAGLLPPEPEEPEDAEEDEGQGHPCGDTLSAEEEAVLEPELGPKERTDRCDRVRREAVRAVSLKELREQMDKATGQGQGGDAGATRTLMNAIATAYPTAVAVGGSSTG